MKDGNTLSGSLCKSWCVDYYKSSQNASQSYTAPI